MNLRAKLVVLIVILLLCSPSCLMAYEEIQLTNSPWGKGIPRWSPDGNWIAYISGYSWGSLYRVSADGAAEVALCDSLHFFPSRSWDMFDWSPDANWLVFPHYEIHICKIRVTGDDFSVLTEQPGSYTDWPRWSPRGDWIVYWASSGNLWRIRPSGADDTELPSYGYLWPEWSPDGNWIVYTGGGTEWCVYKIHLSGDPNICLVQGVLPVWSPDGKWIAYNGGDGGINKISSSGDRDVELAVGYYPEWSPDGNWIAHIDGNGEVCIVSSSGGPQIRLTAGADLDGCVTWSPDGKWIAYGSDQIYKIRIFENKPGIVSGSVIDAVTQNPISGATIVCKSSLGSESAPRFGTMTDANGNYSFALPMYDDYLLEAYAQGYIPQSHYVSLYSTPATSDFELQSQQPDVRYVGFGFMPTCGERPFGTFGNMQVKDESDCKISSGDYVHIYMPFENWGGSQENFYVRFEGLPDQGGGEYHNSMPALSFSLAEDGNYQTELTVHEPVLTTGDRVWVDVWMYVHNLDFEKRMRRNLYGKDTYFWIYWNSGAAEKSHKIRLQIYPVGFKELSPQYDTYVHDDCIHDYRGIEQVAFYQFAAGDTKPPKLIENSAVGVTLYGDVDIPEGAVINGIVTIRSEFEYISSKRRFETSRMFALKRSGKPIGDCKNFADLFCSYGRSLGLPTRFVECMPIAHGWNEVYYSGSWHYSDVGWGWAGPLEGGEWDFVHTRCELLEDCSPDKISYVWADRNPLSSAWVGSGRCFPNPNDHPTYNLFCMSSGPDCYSCIPRSVLWDDAYEEVDCAFEYWADRTVLYRPSSLFLNRTPRYSSSQVDSLRIELNAPIFVEQNVPFNLQANIFNYGPETLMDGTVELQLNTSILDTSDVYSTLMPIVEIDSLVPDDSLMLDWEVTPLIPMDFMILSMSVSWDTNLVYAAAEQRINENGTAPDLLLYCQISENSVLPGDSVQFLVRVYGESLQVVPDANVKANIYSYPDSQFSCTTNFVYSLDDSLYLADLLVPSQAPLGHYTVEAITSKSGYDSDTVTTGFDVLPQLVLATFLNDSVFNITDSIIIHAELSERDSVVGDAHVTVTAKSDSDSVLVALTFDTLTNQYNSAFVIEDLVGSLPGILVPSGQWDFIVRASYYGADVYDTLVARIKSPDLCIDSSDIGFGPIMPIESTFVTIWVNVRNCSYTSSESTIVSFYLDQVDDSHILGSGFPVHSLAEGDSLYVITKWYASDLVGAHTLFAMVDPDSSCVQSTRANDLSSIGLEIYEPYRRGDPNNDGEVTIVDVVYLINYLFRSGPEPTPYVFVADINCDDSVDLIDIVYLINYLFKSGPKPCP